MSSFARRQEGYQETPESSSACRSIKTNDTKAAAYIHQVYSKGKQWSSGRRWLARIHIIVVGLLVLSVAVGASYASQKWSHLSARVHRVTGSDVVDGVANQKGLDYNLTSQLLTKDWRYAFENCRDPRFSVFVLADEKAAFKARRRVNPDAAISFSSLLLCTEILSEIILPYSPYTNNSAKSDDASLTSVFAAGENEACNLWEHQLPTTHTAHVFHVLGFSRICLSWNDSGELAVPPILTATRGLVSPNYPLERYVEKLFTNWLLTLGIVAIAWSHSWMTSQSWFVIHVPRFLFYVLCGIYRIGLLYYGAGGISAIPQFQRQMFDLESRINFSPYWVDRAVVIGSFDFSDHIVLNTTLMFILSTELFCSWKFWISTPWDDGDRPYFRDALRNTRQPWRSCVPPGQLESPIKLPTILLQLLSAAIIGLIILLAYSSFITAAFFHSPLESFVGLAVGVAGTFGAFWLAIQIDILIPKLYFGLE